MQCIVICRAQDSGLRIIRRTAERFRHARMPLCRHGNKAPFVDIIDLIEHRIAERAAVASALDMLTGLSQMICAADRADARTAGAGDADLFFDARVDLTNQVGIARGSDHIGICCKAAVGLACLRETVGDRAQLRPEDARRLVCRCRIVIEDAGHADKSLLQFGERRIGEAVAVAVDLIVTEDEVKEIDLIERMLSACECIELLQQLILILFHKAPFIPPPARFGFRIQCGCIKTF